MPLPPPPERCSGDRKTERKDGGEDSGRVGKGDAWEELRRLEQEGNGTWRGTEGVQEEKKAVVKQR